MWQIWFDADFGMKLLKCSCLFSISLQYSFRPHFERHLVVSIFFPIANLIMKALSFRSISFAYANINKQE